ncbi:MAG TPA: FAD-dependent oxidoreductase, partial [Anaerolineae bacterium]|nr:FAD-dependent oxidoreductase [Anaerolineae bacterium]
WLVRGETAEGERVWSGRGVVLAVDAPAAKRLLLNSPALAEQAAGMHFPQGVPTAIIRLWYDKQPRGVSEAGMFSGDFVMDNFFWLERLQPAYQAWHAATGGSAVEAHIYGPPELLAQPDVALIAQVSQGMHRAFPDLRGHQVQARLTRNEAAHTLFSVGTADEHLGVDTPWPGLYACGDWVAHPAPALYLERAVTTGLDAANAFLLAEGGAPWPVAAHPAPEALAGWLSQVWYGVRQWRLGRQKG